LNEREIVCADLNRAIDDLRREGFRLDVIYPADDPQAAVLSRSEERVRVAIRNAPALPAGLPDFVPEFVLTRAGETPGQGRAGMLYRDLIPSRLGGRYVASHISVAEGGPVDDWVHYHRIALQMIFVRSGWVRLVYEDQGEPFVMNEGDLVLQPPGIRHRVLESSAGLEVVEISAPALHETFADHQLSLPNGERQGRSFGNQRFLCHVAAQSAWTQSNGAEVQQTAMLDATGGLADVRVLRAGNVSQIMFAPHDGELVFGFILDGTASLDGCELNGADAFVVPPGEGWSLRHMSSGFRLLHVTTGRLDAAA
jgi:quercetin dioxygenase-like cupin family protein